MTSADLALAAMWAGLVIGAAARHRPSTAPGRLAIVERRSGRPAPPRKPAAAVAALGTAVRRLTGGRASGISDGVLGCTVLAGGAGLLLLPPLGALVGLPIWLGAHLRARRRPAALGHALTRDLTEAVELLRVALSSGLSTRAALEEVCPWLGGPLRAELVLCLERADRGWSLADELEALPERLHPCTRQFSAVLVSAERYGAPVVAGLVRLGEELRADGRRHLEEAARRAPVRLLVPLVGGILPAFVLLAVVPLLAGALAGLRDGP